MSRVLTRSQLCAALEEAGVEFPNSATVAQLRALHERLDERPPVLIDEENPPLANDNNIEVMLPHGDNNVNAAVEDDEQEIARLRRRRELLELQREVRLLEQDVQPVHLRRVDFSDVENALSPFTGDDSYSVRK